MMWNPPTYKQLEKIPKLYAQENVKDPKVYMKFFIGSYTWLVTEYDPVSRTFFGWIINDNEPGEGSFGFFTLDQLMKLRAGFIEVDRDIYEVTPYSPKKLSELLRRRN